MQINIALLTKKATREALKGDWHAAIKTNSLILTKDKKNIDAKLRLGHSYIQTKHLTKARKEFKDVLEIDPINQVAHKNLLLINNHVEVTSPTKASSGALIKEPGTTTVAKLKLVGRGNDSESFASGELLMLTIKKRSVDIYRIKKENQVYIGTIEDAEIVKALNKAVDKEAIIKASFMKGRARDAEILIKSSIPVFKAEKQDVRPYIKKGTLEDEEEEIEEEMEMAELS